ncbi:MAG: hypothetical protein WD077_01595 [Bacteroidia bacterium]
MKLKSVAAFFMLTVMAACSTAEEKILGLACFRPAPDDILTAPDSKSYREYIAIAEDILYLENVPLTRVVTAPGRVTFIALPLGEADSVIAAIRTHPALAAHRDDEWGQHYLLRLTEFGTYALLHKGEGGQPVLFLNVFEHTAAAEAAFAEKTFFAQYLTCK